MLDTFLGLIKWFLILAVVATLFIYIGIPIITVVAAVGLCYYLYRKFRLARQRARFTPEGRRKVN
ncbi:hypothetical protein [Companilactobacillus mishanensis]|uniref:Uncharacterized protein n=1 Tax=Companilactobacillus mishanensis TaxID=2486008 RepID=A0ABW9P5A2_9LACO|nr:hypothetical protein [Companilactobacillus mishanensis]MQS44341.1 hypothetical protein [Companilactobacillus mishanensis]